MVLFPSTLERLRKEKLNVSLATINTLLSQLKIAVHKELILFYLPNVPLPFQNIASSNLIVFQKSFSSFFLNGQVQHHKIGTLDISLLLF